MECLTSPNALTRCPKRVRFDSEYVDSLPTWANGHEGNGNDYGNSIGWDFQVFDLPAELLTPAPSPDSAFGLAESTNPSTLLPHQFRSYSPPDLRGKRSRPLSQAPQQRRLRLLRPKPTSGTAKLDAEPQRATSPDVKPLDSPFTLPEDSPDILLKHDSPYSRPSSGRVDGFIKLNWPPSETSGRPPTLGISSRSKKNSNQGTPASGRLPFCGSKTAISRDPSDIASGSTSSVTIDRDWTFVSSANITSQQTWAQPQARPAQIKSMFPSSHSGLQSQKDGSQKDGSQKDGSQKDGSQKDGSQEDGSQEDGFDMRLLTFYLKNWYPGRSVLVETNPWLLILAQACRNTAISAAIASAIGCLAGMYIYDYLADERIRKAACRRYTMAAKYYQELLKELKSKRPGEGEESITLGVVLSTIHVVQVRQRHGKPGSPSWLEGYKQCKHFLHQTNSGGPFWENVAVKRSHLRDALSVIVGRGLIFSQLLAPLPDADLFNPLEQATEFNWLLFGNERETLEIHGGCGLSTRLMHSIAHVSYCYSFVIFAALAQKAHGADRNPRLPRNHPSVVGQMDDLARCIRIIPTSGPCFTAQAPLLPAFILGLLAIGTDHKKVSQTWFEQILKTPVRSVSGDVICTHDDFFKARMLMSLDQSVPLLLESLKRTWCWIDNGIKTPTPLAVLPEAICERDPWWEKLVAAITESEGGILCVV
ncbi:hypothetical protein MRS44_018219 [Fusarium solani]|uniref:uncharacterized protein n=1 Tax=Fusarium solani TaxID=169388 RepID=UPI0032C3E741|nr:hypothetical protein MRS44_018219 [Fusarium solani]